MGRWGETMHLRLTCILTWDAEAKIYVSRCPELRVYSQGTDEREAIRALKEAATLFLKQCAQRGILDQTMAARRFNWEDAVVAQGYPSDENTPTPGAVFDVTLPALQPA